MQLAFWMKFKQLTDELGISEVQFVLYIRRQDQYYCSSYRQMIRGYDSNKFNLELEEPKNEFDYFGEVSRLEQVFGEDCVILRRYGPQYLINGDIRQDFCYALHIPWKPDFIVGENRKIQSEI